MECYPLAFAWQVGDAMDWCIHRRGLDLIFHYLDDFLVMGPLHLDACRHNLQLLDSECRNLGVPLALEKIEGPSSILSFLGIKVNSIEGILHLPANKLKHLSSTITECMAASEIMYPSGVGISYWYVATCMQSHLSRKILPQTGIVECC